MKTALDLPRCKPVKSPQGARSLGGVASIPEGKTALDLPRCKPVKSPQGARSQGGLA
jgi:hypothetical protein